MIDPKRGCLATACIFSPMGEVLASHEKIHVEQVAPEIWYPLGYEETRYAEPNQPEESPKVETWSKIALEDVRVNEPIPGEQFDIEALGLRR